MEQSLLNNPSEIILLYLCNNLTVCKITECSPSSKEPLLPLTGARDRLQDLSLPKRRPDGVSGRAAEMQIQTGQTGGLRVVRTQSPEGNDGQNSRSASLPPFISTL